VGVRHELNLGRKRADRPLSGARPKIKSISGAASAIILLKGMERRTFIIAAVAGGIGLLEYGTVSRYMNGLRMPHGFSVKPYEKYGAKAALMAITPNDSFYVTSKGGTPQLKKEDWSLTVDGLVSHPFKLNYQDVLALPSIEKYLTLECISNPVDGGIVGNALWKGTALKPLLERAGPTAEAKHAIIYAADGFTTGHPIERLWYEENFLAYQMNGEDLPYTHGFPMRIFIPGKFGMKQPKWVTRIQLVDKHYLGYWEQQGWSDTCERWAHARFTDPQDGAEISGKNFELTGYAIGNLDGMRAVEISLDDGRTWQKTDLYSNPSPLTWSFWKYVWVDPKPGKYKIKVRAIDGKGRVEPHGPQDTFPDGATGQETFKVKVV
jgi:DMSO/TMAO reductase YedYZ molybdopterin-dependent catalytic subunit